MDQVNEVELSQEVNPIVTQAGQVIVTTETVEMVGEFLRKVVATKKKIKGHFDPMKKAASAAHKAICIKEKELLAPLEQAESGVKLKVSNYYAEQERIRQKKEAEAREKQRIADEEARLALAEQAEAEGEIEVAEQILETPTAAPVAISKPAPKPQGISTKTTWKAEVTSLTALVKAVADGKAPLALIQANQVVINQQATSLKDSFKCPGIKVFPVTSTAVRT
jgi:hypothetical protein